MRIKKVLSISVTKEMQELLKKIAKEKYMTVSAVVIQAIEEKYNKAK
ncbi:MAG: hypothetical protein ACRC6E_11420 [Fusobacteriaceae bacterium]